ncbi:MAG: hypothetical protein NVS2B16_01240 [Chloroflexota bacterium]
MKIKIKRNVLFTRRGLVAAVMLGTLALSAAPSTGTTLAAGPAAKGTINIGTKNFAEEYVISDMYRLLLQKAGFNVPKTHDLAQTPILQKALLQGSIDLYPEYTGTGLGVVLKQTRSVTNAAQAYAKVKKGYKKFHLTWLAQTPMNDTNGVAVTQATASKYNLHTLSDLAKAAGKLTFAALPDCKDRPDCLGGLKSVYSVNFKSVQFIGSQPVMYKGVKSGLYDAIEVFTTDGPIKALKLVVLKDDRGIFPADHIAPVVRDSTLAKYPEVRTVLNKLAPYITTKAMIKLNVRAVLNSEDPMSVAQSFLQSKHLL